MKRISQEKGADSVWCVARTKTGLQSLSGHAIGHKPYALIFGFGQKTDDAGGAFSILSDFGLTYPKLGSNNDTSEAIDPDESPGPNGSLRNSLPLLAR